MPTVTTVLGPVDVADLGFTLTHEHIYTASAGILQTYPELFGDLEDLRSQAISTLIEARDGGVRTLIELSTLDLGRDVRFFADVSRRTGVNVIAATGIWRDIPRALWNRHPDQIADLFVREIEVGIEGTGIKAGIIKVANDREGVTPEAEIILRAAARAAMRTGVRVSTHTYAPGRVGEQQVAVFESEGLDMNRVYIGHSNDSTDLDYLLGLVNKGVWLGMDRHQTSLPIGPDAEGRAQTLAALIKAGVGDRLMVSHDWSVLGVSRTSDPRASRIPNPDGWLFAKRKLFPRLLELGVSQAQVDALNVDNPRRFLGG
ncbi:MAG: phosphotriesterase-related protein [Chloroflexi bacterium]|nr:phosphotriesterase-related protein [Chloroflexota bacterium]